MKVVSTLALLLAAGAVLQAPEVQAKDITHGVEHYILQAQNGERWAADDKAVESKLAEIRKANDGKRPNIVYILLDDIGYGEIGTPDLTPSRGYSTPNIDAISREGMTFYRMYTEPSCTPTRVSMMTGRYPVRTGTTEAKATLAGDGLNADEVTIAEVLRRAGYRTGMIGKWHLKEIPEAFDYFQLGGRDVSIAQLQC